MPTAQPFDLAFWVGGQIKPDAAIPAISGVSVEKRPDGFRLSAPGGELILAEHLPGAPTRYTITHLHVEKPSRQRGRGRQLVLSALAVAQGADEPSVSIATGLVSRGAGRRFWDALQRRGASVRKMGGWQVLDEAPVGLHLAVGMGMRWAGHTKGEPKDYNPTADEVARAEHDILTSAHTSAIEKQYAKQIAKALARQAKYGDDDTLRRYSDPATGKLDPARKALHADILAQWLRDQEAKAGKPIPQFVDDPVVIFVGGPPAAGKTTFIDKRLDLTNKLVISSDTFKTYLPEYTGDNAAEVHRESSELAQMAMAYAIAHGMNVVDDGVQGRVGVEEAEGHLQPMSGTVATMETFRGAGYRVEMRVVDVPMSLAMERNILRFIKGETVMVHGEEKVVNRLVPPDYLRLAVADPEYGSKPNRIFDLVKTRMFKGAPLLSAYAKYDGDNRLFTIAQAMKKAPPDQRAALQQEYDAELAAKTLVEHGTLSLSGLGGGLPPRPFRRWR